MEIRFGDNTKLDRKLWLRLLGVGEEHIAKAGTEEKIRAALARLEEQMDEAEVLLLKAAEPCFAYRILEEGELDIMGESIRRHLEGCGRLAIMAVTLGEGVDRLIDETQRNRIALGAVIDSGASVMTELAAQEATGQIRAEIAALYDNEPVFMTGRFSPGYGDAPLEMQIQLLQLLDAEETLGIHLSKGLMMSPSKSITAIIGLADHPVTGRLATCDECVLRDKCQLKKEGKRCYSTSRG